MFSGKNDRPKCIDPVVVLSQAISGRWRVSHKHLTRAYQAVRQAELRVAYGDLEAATLPELRTEWLAVWATSHCGMVRAEIAGSADALAFDPHGVLADRFLKDRDARVRAAAANNPSIPVGKIARLRDDSDAGVRGTALERLGLQEPTSRPF